MTLTADTSSTSRLLAIEIGGTKLQLAVGTRAGVILERRRFKVESERGAEGIRECIASDLPELLKQWQADAAERERIFQRYWTHAEGYLWFLQNDPEVPQAIRDEARQFGFPKDEFTDNRHRPHHIYVREGRRIWGEYNFTERDAALDNATGLPRRKPDGIAVAEFGFDSHGVHKYDPAHPGVREGYIFIEHQPLQLPYRILVPKRVDGLLVPVACSASHVGYQTIRMEPVFMALGEACGIAAKVAQDTKVEVRSVNVPAVQKEIIKRGGVVLYENTTLTPTGL